MSDKMRESFEKWGMSRALDLRMDKDAWGQDSYYNSHIDAMWESWQAAHAAALPPGFVAVPFTKERIKAEFDAFIEYPEGSGELYVTTTSALLFAYLISQMTADAAMLAARPEVK